MRKNYSHIELLLDRSGSMDSIKTDMEGGIKTFLNEQRAARGLATFALRQFDDRYEVVIQPTPLDLVRNDRIKLVPRGMTALLDAMGKSITEAGEYLASMDEDDRPEHVFFVIVTDGLENASHEWSKDKISELVKAQTEQYGWNFIYLGANQDAIAEAGSMGIAPAGSMNYRSDNIGSTYSVASASVLNTRSGRGPIDLPDDAPDEASLSYARFGWEGSDVYVFATSYGGEDKLECCGCILNVTSQRFSSVQEMVDHLAEHTANGHHVPDTVVPELWDEEAEIFPAQKGVTDADLRSRQAGR